MYLTGADVVVATGANGAVDGVLEAKSDPDGKPAAAAAVPKEVGGAVVVLLVPNGVAVDVLPPKCVNEEVVPLGREVAVEAGVEPNPNVEG